MTHLIMDHTCGLLSGCSGLGRHCLLLTTGTSSSGIFVPGALYKNQQRKNLNNNISYRKYQSCSE
jgi:hypothetical protein